MDKPNPESVANSHYEWNESAQTGGVWGVTGVMWRWTAGDQRSAIVQHVFTQSDVVVCGLETLRSSIWLERLVIRCAHLHFWKKHPAIGSRTARIILKKYQPVSISKQKMEMLSVYTLRVRYVSMFDICWLIACFLSFSSYYSSALLLQIKRSNLNIGSG